MYLGGFIDLHTDQMNVRDDQRGEWLVQADMKAMLVNDEETILHGKILAVVP